MVANGRRDELDTAMMQTSRQGIAKMFSGCQRTCSRLLEDSHGIRPLSGADERSRATSQKLSSDRATRCTRICLKPDSARTAPLAAKITFTRASGSTTGKASLNKVLRCTQFLAGGGCYTRCKKIHLDKHGKLRPSVGLHRACELEREQRLIQVFM